MKILVSACLLGKNCKYNGGDNYNKIVCELAKEHQMFPVCPEVLGGLSTPRCPSEIVKGVVMNKEGITWTENFTPVQKKLLPLRRKIRLILQYCSPVVQVVG